VHLPASLAGAGAGAAQFVVAGEGGGHVGDVAAERGGQGHRVLERLARALAEVGGHRVGGVAEQRDPADGEPRERAHQLRGLDDVDVRRGIDQRGDAGVPVGAVVPQRPASLRSSDGLVFTALVRAPTTPLPSPPGCVPRCAGRGGGVAAAVAIQRAGSARPR